MLGAPNNEFALEHRFHSSLIGHRRSVAVVSPGTFRAQRGSRGQTARFHFPRGHSACASVVLTTMKHPHSRHWDVGAMNRSHARHSRRRSALIARLTRSVEGRRASRKVTSSWSSFMSRSWHRTDRERESRNELTIG